MTYSFKTKPEYLPEFLTAMLSVQAVVGIEGIEGRGEIDENGLETIYIHSEKGDPFMIGMQVGLYMMQAIQALKNKLPLESNIWLQGKGE